MAFSHTARSHLTDTVDGQNLAPVGRWLIPVFIGLPPQLVHFLFVNPQHDVLLSLGSVSNLLVVYLQSRGDFDKCISKWVQQQVCP